MDDLRHVADIQDDHHEGSLLGQTERWRILEMAVDTALWNVCF